MTEFLKCVSRVSFYFSPHVRTAAVPLSIVYFGSWKHCDRSVSWKTHSEGFRFGQMTQHYIYYISVATTKQAGPICKESLPFFFSFGSFSIHEKQSVVFLWNRRPLLYLPLERSGLKCLNLLWYYWAAQIRGNKSPPMEAHREMFRHTVSACQSTEKTHWKFYSREQFFCLVHGV